MVEIDKSKPTIVVSKCLGFDNCRYDGGIIPSEFVKRLVPYVNYIKVCPEVAIGLGVPRDPINLVMKDPDGPNERITLFQPNTGNTYTEEMEEYIEKTLKSFDDVDIHGFILKGRSPSCGIKDTKIHLFNQNRSVKGHGMFAGAVKEKYPSHPTEEEGRLTNYGIREHFLTKLYTFFEFEQAIKSGKLKDLIDFHSDNKYLLMAYSRVELDNLGKLAANQDNKSFKEIADDYRRHLGIAFQSPPARGSYINSLMHIMGYFSDDLSSKEKKFMLDKIEKYREEKIHLGVLLGVLEAYTIQYDQEYLLRQKIWRTYPDELLDISNSGKTEM